MKFKNLLKIFYLSSFLWTFSAFCISVKESMVVRAGADLAQDNIYKEIPVDGFYSNAKESSGLRLGDKWQIYNLLLTLFSDVNSGESGSSSELEKIIEKYVLDYPNFFGGSCNPYEFSFDPSQETVTVWSTRLRVEGNFSSKTMCNEIGEIQVPYLVHGISRIALMVKFCHEAINLHEVVDRMEEIACLNNGCTSIGISKKAVSNLFNHFYPYVAIRDSEVDSIYNTLCDGNLRVCPKKTSIKAFSLALCQDPNYLNF